MKNINELIGRHIKIYNACFYDLKFLERNSKTIKNIDRYKKEGIVLYVKGNINYYKVEVVLLKNNENEFRNEKGKILSFDDLIIKRIHGRLTLFNGEFYIVNGKTIK